jgi:cytosine/adenosine deaminase-related metal-dependent hydrolase
LPTGDDRNSGSVTVQNLWISPVEDEEVRPRFVELTLEEGRIRGIRSADFRAYLHGDSPGVAPASPPTPGRSGRRIDAGGRVATPPLVNFHEHFYSRLARGLQLPGPTGSFPHILESFWWRLDRALDLEMVEACARLGVLESIRSGTGYVFDHHCSPEAVEGSLEAVAGALVRAGLRGSVCFEVSDRNGPEVARRALEENRRFLSGPAAQAGGPVRGLVGLHAPFTLSEQTLREAAALARELDAGIHIHLAEDACEQEHSRRQHGLPPALRLQCHGLLTRPGILAHGVHLSEEDWPAVAAGRCALALNPDSNLNNAVGLPDLAAIPEAVLLVPGTDGMHASAGRSLKQLFLLSRHQGRSLADSFALARRVFCGQLPFVRRFFPDYPTLREGDRADLVLWDYRPASPLDSDTFWGHLIHGLLESPAWAMWMGGRSLLREGRHRSLDAEEVGRQAALQGERLFEKLGGKRHG